MGQGTGFVTVRSDEVLPTTTTDAATGTIIRAGAEGHDLVRQEYDSGRPPCAVTRKGAGSYLLATVLRPAGSDPVGPFPSGPEGGLSRCRQRFGCSLRCRSGVAVFDVDAVLGVVVGDGGLVVEF
ncbi:hypothetical protein ACTMSW_03985, partial [Micromonospora sp. BQ11]|uniref:hypothetical protein n=1 Tax=Micromonospora sp. BQ11 TaxID=3452212 RepID=UPI003F8C72E2